jgi:hypothetical protein
MIASRAGLVVLAALAVVLAVFATCGHRAAAVDHTVFPGFDAAKVRELTWARPGQPPVAAEGIPGDWKVAQPPGRADAATISDFFAAMRGARWHREADPSMAGPARVHVALGGDTAYEFDLGNQVEGTDQVWLVTVGKALLVDGWVARALAPDVLALRERHPLGDAASSERVMVDGLVLAGHPRRLDRLWLEPSVVHDLEDAMTQLELVALEPSSNVVAQPDRMHAATTDLDVTAAGACTGDRVFVHATIGDGCVERTRWRAIAERAAPLLGPPEKIVDRHPLPIDATKLVLPGGATIDRTRRPQLDGKDADPDRVAELVAALRAPAEVAPLPAGAPAGSIVAGEMTIDLYDHVLARRGEPVALRPTPEAWKVIARPASAYRDPTRWREEPTTISALTIDGTTYARGAVIGEWKDAKDASLLEALATAVATVVAAEGPAPARVEHRVDVQVTPPVGSPVTHHLEVGPIGQGGCAGRADGQAVVLTLELCTAVLAAAR